MPNNILSFGRPRKQWVDFLRAVAIFLVVYGHQIQLCPRYFAITSPVKMPLFFAISGYLFSIKTAGEYVKKVALSLIVPWLLLSILPLFVVIPINGVSSFVSSAGKVISGEIAWFMPCFIISSILFYVMILSVRSVTQSNKWGGYVGYQLYALLSSGFG